MSFLRCSSSRQYPFSLQHLVTAIPLYLSRTHNSLPSLWKMYGLGTFGLELGLLVPFPWKNTGIETYGHHLTHSLNDEKTTLCPKDLISSFAHVLILPNVAVSLRFMLLCESDRSCSLLLVYISLIKKEQVSGVSRGTLGSLGLEGLWKQLLGWLFPLWCLRHDANTNSWFGRHVRRTMSVECMGMNSSLLPLHTPKFS